MKHSDEMNQDEKLLQQLRTAVLDNLGNDQFGVESLANEVGMSRSHLHRKLKKLREQSISRFIRQVRLEEAMKLLRQDAATVSEIAFRVGFSSTSYFSKCFYEQYGYPPGEAQKVFHKKDGRSSSATDAAAVPQDAKAEPTEKSPTSPPAKTPDVLEKKPSPGKARVPVYKILGLTAFLLAIGFAAFYFLKKPPISPTREKSIAVLPFTNLSSDENNQHFADGLVEDLLHRLSLMEGFKVISRTSSEMYRERGTKPVPQIARELGVSYIIEGSVQKDAGRARINIQLIDAQSDAHIWSKPFDRDLDDIFDVQSEIAIQIAAELNAILSPQQTTVVRAHRTKNVKAFELYQLGRFYWNKRTREGYRTSIEYFEQAIAEDPDYGLAYAGLADNYNLMAIMNLIDRKKGRDKAVELALKALELDGSLAEAYTVLGSIYTYVDWNWAEAEEAYLRAIQLNPNYSTAYHYYSEHLSITGRHEEARKAINTALELDPLSFIIRFVSAKLYYNRGLFQEALSEIEVCRQLNEGHPWIAFYQFKISRNLGNSQAALDAFQKVGKRLDLFTAEQVDSAYAASGLDGLVHWQIEFTDQPLGKARLFGALGEDEKAMDWLEKPFRKGTIHADFTFTYEFRKLHSYPRFIALLKEMGLPWKPGSKQ